MRALLQRERDDDERTCTGFFYFHRYYLARFSKQCKRDYETSFRGEGRISGSDSDRAVEIECQRCPNIKPPQHTDQQRVSGRIPHGVCLLQAISVPDGSAL